MRKARREVKGLLAGFRYRDLRQQVRDTIRRSDVEVEIELSTAVIGEHLVDLNGGVIHVWRSASKTGATKTPQSRRWLVLPKRSISALRTHKAMQDRERAAAGRNW